MNLAALGLLCVATHVFFTGHAVAQPVTAHCVQEARHICESGKECRALSDGASNQWMFSIQGDLAHVQRCAGKDCGEPVQARVSRGSSDSFHLWEPIANETFSFSPGRRDFTHVLIGPTGDYVVSEFGHCVFEH
jgi:hypothetical protein